MKIQKKEENSNNTKFKEKQFFFRLSSKKSKFSFLWKRVRFSLSFLPRMKVVLGLGGFLGEEFLKEKRDFPEKVGEVVEEGEEDELEEEEEEEGGGTEEVKEEFEEDFFF